jgi:hypothetical protein
MVLNVLSSAMAGTAIPLTGTTATRKIFVPDWQVEKTPAEAADVEGLSSIVWY